MRPFKYNPNNHTGRFNKKVYLHRTIVKNGQLSQKVKEIEEKHSFCLWSMIKTTKGDEYFNAAQTKSVNTTRFVVRFSTALRDFIEDEKTSFVIKYRGVIYDVKSAINDDEANLTYTIVAEGRL